MVDGSPRRWLFLIALAAGCGIDTETWGHSLDGADRLVVLFHGYGAPAADLKGLAIDLREYGQLHRACFALARGPRSAGSGRAWFDDRAEIGSLRSRLLALLGKLGARSELPASKIFVGGFSQGAAVAVDLALHAPEPLGGVLVLSSPPGPAGDWDASAARNRATRFFIAHGTSDARVPAAAAARLRAQLEGAGHPVELLSFAGGHEMTDEVRRAAARFLSVSP